MTVRRLSSWLPPLAWMGVVLWMSTDLFSAAQTGSLLGPVLRWLLPWATPAQIAGLLAAIRKLAHLVAYGLLALPWFRAARREDATARVATWTALGVAVSWGMLDEYLQSRTTSRSGSVVDVGIDTTGAALALTAARGEWRRVVDGVSAVLLWIACVGGAIVLVLNAISGVGAIAPWVTTTAAGLLLLLRRRRIAAQRRDPRAARARGAPPPS